MKYLWEPVDISAGRFIWSHNRSELFIISYQYMFDIDGSPAWYSLTSLVDGQTQKFIQKNQLVQILNDLEAEPDNLHEMKSVSDALRELK